MRVEKRFLFVLKIEENVTNKKQSNDLSRSGKELAKKSEFQFYVRTQFVYSSCIVRIQFAYSSHTVRIQFAYSSYTVRIQFISLKKLKRFL